MSHVKTPQEACIKLENEKTGINPEQETKVAVETNISPTTKGGLLIILIACSFLVLVVGGYNNFLPADMTLLVRVSVVFVLLLPTIFLYKSEGRWKEYWKLSFSFLIVSIGLVVAWLVGTLYALFPGLSPSTVEGVAVLKVVEVLPIVLTILVGMWLVEKDFAPIFLRGGNIKKSFKLGLLVSPAALLLVIPLGFLGLTVSLGVAVSWMPWLCLFAISNAFYEELMIRGLFLRKYDSLFGPRQSLLLTSFIFAMLHISIIGLADLVTFSLYFGLSFMLGVLWAYVIQKSDNIWGAVLAHTIADILFVLTVFGV
ncbi:MAG: CPBP family intramembrane metalloprotease [Candidatus Thorarchaeota archaeon]|nr:MAG: CPBP family intramembrane metalloprotease [Candidatus Thorarchaeota archaeon]